MTKLTQSKKITPLRKRFTEDLQLAGYSPRTVEAYVGAVKKLAEHYQQSPDTISEEQLRNYFLYIKNVKRYSRSASTTVICGIKFFGLGPKFGQRDTDFIRISRSFLRCLRGML